MTSSATDDPAVDPGRRFSVSRVVRIGDAGPDARLQLDAVGRYLQDIASDDMADAGVPGTFWVVRRTALHLSHRPRLGETVVVTTRCTGQGSRWAERFSTIEGPSGRIESTALWVHIDPETGRPTRVPERVTDVYRTAAAGRSISSRFRLPAVPDEACTSEPWPVRPTDLDVVRHVNNAVYWGMVERHPIATGTIELEYRLAIDLDDDVRLLTSPDGLRRWLVSDAGVHAVAEVQP